MEKTPEFLLAHMTLCEKIQCCHAGSKFATAPIDRLGLPPLTLSDGPHGVREEISADTWDPVGGESDYATYLPTASALAATWSTDCAGLFGEVLGAEARDRNKDVILGPGVNIVRNPLCGRNFEYYSEDPYLTAQLAATVIRAIQKQGVAACVKHFALNSQEMNRCNVNARCDERTLREIYLPAFEAAVKDADVLCVMGAYNRFNGQYCCQNDFLLNQILKQEWGFKGLTVSDWNGVHNTLEAVRGGMDLEMGTEVSDYDSYYLAKPFRTAIESGEVDVAILDDKVRRYLHVMEKTGLLNPASRPKGQRNTPKHRAAALKIAEEAAVLLKNDGDFLPLDSGKIRRLVVVGENAVRKHSLGGHSSAVKTEYEITPLEGLKSLLDGSGIAVDYYRGYPQETVGEPIKSSCMGISDAGAGTRGWICELYSDRRHPERIDYRIPLEQPRFDFESDLPEKLKGTVFGGRISGEFTPEEGGDWTFFCEGISQTALYCEGAPNWLENCKSKENNTASATICLAAGHTYRLVMPLFFHADMPLYSLRLTARKGKLSPQEADSGLLKAATEADAVLFFGGQNHNFDCEGTDRKDMCLHDGQNECIAQLAAVNSKLAVVLIGGSPVEMPWLSNVAAVLQMWYAGMEGGHAAARLLFGRSVPSGKLPFTFPCSWSTSPVGANGDYRFETCDYQEGVFVGYRWFDSREVAPLFPFGHGLSYTKFELSDARREPDVDGECIHCSIQIRNGGSLAGAEVVQLYVEAPSPANVQRPIRELKGFKKVFLSSGETKRISFQLPPRAFAYFHPIKRKWVIETGIYRLRFGVSSTDLREELTLSIPASEIGV